MCNLTFTNQRGSHTDPSPASGEFIEALRTTPVSLPLLSWSSQGSTQQKDNGTNKEGTCEDRNAPCNATLLSAEEPRLIKNVFLGLGLMNSNYS